MSFSKIIREQKRFLACMLWMRLSSITPPHASRQKNQVHCFHFWSFFLISIVKPAPLLKSEASFSETNLNNRWAKHWSKFCSDQWGLSACERYKYSSAYSPSLDSPLRKRIRRGPRCNSHDLASTEVNATNWKDTNWDKFNLKRCMNDIENWVRYTWSSSCVDC